MKKILIAANWKMYKGRAEAEAFFAAWRPLAMPAEREVAFFPPFTLLGAVKRMLPPGQEMGGQNLHEAAEGAFTGEISAPMLSDAGCSYVLVGHSERRHVFGETESRIAKKFSAALNAGLRPVLCVGEKLDERESGRTLEVVLGQMASALGILPPAKGFDVAYEPVWAIGTGKVAKAGDAATVHRAILDWLTKRGAGKDARILYGGSVKPDNAAELLAADGIHGLLVGGASLEPLSFHKIATAGM
jgi:triosephosphate isomerase